MEFYTLRNYRKVRILRTAYRRELFGHWPVSILGAPGPEVFAPFGASFLLLAKEVRQVRDCSHGRDWRRTEGVGSSTSCSDLHLLLVTTSQKVFPWLRNRKSRELYVREQSK